MLPRQPLPWKWARFILQTEDALTLKACTNNKQFLERMVAGVAESAVLGLTIQKISGQQPLSSISVKAYGMRQKKWNQSILIRSL